jgi:hypothetical protein
MIGGLCAAHLVKGGSHACCLMSIKLCMQPSSLGAVPTVISGKR